MRAEIQIRADVSPYERAILAEHAAADVTAKKALADTIAEIKAGLRNWVSRRSSITAPPPSILGVFAPSRPNPVDEFIRANSRIAPLEARLKELLPVPVAEARTPPPLPTPNAD